MFRVESVFYYFVMYEVLLFCLINKVYLCLESGVIGIVFIFIFIKNIEVVVVVVICEYLNFFIIFCFVVEDIELVNVKDSVKKVKSLIIKVL